MRTFKSQWRIWLGVLSLLLTSHEVATAHSVQNEPSHVQIAPRHQYLTIQITGDAVDWRDAISGEEHEGHSPAGTPKDASEAAAKYAQSHLVLEQGGQVLRLSFQKMQWKKLREGDESSERIEMFLRAARPEKLASAPLSVASNLFNNLEKASTVVQIGDSMKTIRGPEIAEFPAKKTLPTLTGDLGNFA